MTFTISATAARPASGFYPSLLMFALLASLTLTLGTTKVLAQDQSLSAEGVGSSNIEIPVTAPISIGPSLTVPGAEFTSAGAALRNRGSAAIHISGIVPPVSNAFLYWAVMTNNAPPAAVQRLRIKRLAPAPASVNYTAIGAIIGTGPPCWSGTQITVFRAGIPTGIVNGNGLYQVTLLAGAGGRTDGADPFDPPITLPLWEGASLVVVGAGTGTVSFFDNTLAGITFVPAPGTPLNYTLALPMPGAGFTYLDNIGADGQHVLSRSRTADWRESDETTDINGVRIAGFGSDYLDSDWNGSSGLPVPELWDDTGHDITRAALGTSALNVTISNAGGAASDCLTTVANIVRQ